MSSQLEIVTASTPEHFAHMSLLHALGWRDTYKGYVPDDYMAREITDARWVPYFQRAYETGESTGLLAYVQGRPVSCLNYGPARTDNYNAGTVCTFPNAGYEDWGELMWFVSHPSVGGYGYGGLLFDAALDRLLRDGFQWAFVFARGPGGFTPPTALPGTGPGRKFPSRPTRFVLTCGMCAIYNKKG